MSSRRLQVELSPRVLKWARERASLEPDELANKVGVKKERILEWERDGRLSLAQADKLAHHTHTPRGYLYLREPPEDQLTIPDLRTLNDRENEHASPELLDTVGAMQLRQAWFREELVEQGAARIELAASSEDGLEIGRALRTWLGLENGWASEVSTWSGAISFLRRTIEDAGVIAVINGVVGNNTHRALDPSEFQGFAITDDYAPLIFVNGADFKSAQMFTLIHELAHVHLGQSGVSNEDLSGETPSRAYVEQVCNSAAAEFLVPRDDLAVVWPRFTGDDRFLALARHFKTSPIAVARRARETDLIGRGEFLRFWTSYRDDERRLSLPNSETDGGNFWNNQNFRIGQRFGAAVARAVREGRLPYNEAYALTDLRGPTFETFLRWTGVES